VGGQEYVSKQMGCETKEGAPHVTGGRGPVKRKGDALANTRRGYQCEKTAGLQGKKGWVWGLEKGMGTGSSGVSRDGQRGGAVGKPGAEVPKAALVGAREAVA